MAGKKKPIPKMKKALTIPEQIAQEGKYVEFLRVRLDSENYKVNSTPEEYELTRQKHDKAKFKLKTLKERINQRN